MFCVLFPPKSKPRFFYLCDCLYGLFQVLQYVEGNHHVVLSIKLIPLNIHELQLPSTYHLFRFFERKRRDINSCHAKVICEFSKKRAISATDLKQISSGFCRLHDLRLCRSLVNKRGCGCCEVRIIVYPPKNFYHLSFYVTQYFCFVISSRDVSTRTRPSFAFAESFWSSGFESFPKSSILFCSTSKENRRFGKTFKP